MADRDRRPDDASIASDPLEIYAMPGHLIRRMHQASMAIFDSSVAGAGIDLTSVQFAALVAIESKPGLDQATLAGAIAYDRVTIGGVVDRLEAKGYVRREIDPEDRRARRLHLEPAGRRILQRATPIVRELQAAILAGLNEREVATLVKLLTKALAAVADQRRVPLRQASAT